ncbi:MAG: lytic transglycosylase domain-containing protein [Gemmatimonadetes bacterium]|nr:lytic transglycosylase domain-containing protein [Gemmatimonadota bacterium]
MEETRTHNTAGRDNLRGLLRNRGVQLLLVGVAALQGAVTAKKAESGEMSGLVSRQQQTRVAARVPAQHMLPAVVVSDLAGTFPEVASVAAVDEAEEAAAPEADAQALASRYEKKGFRVSDQMAKLIQEAALANDIDPEVAFGLVKTESGFKNSATSHVGAIGLTQLMPRTARWLKPGTTARDLRNPETNLHIGFGYLRKLIDRYDGDTRLALLAYNRGPGTVDKVLKRGGNPDNGYADMVLGEE